MPINHNGGDRPVAEMAQATRVMRPPARKANESRVAALKGNAGMARGGVRAAVTTDKHRFGQEGKGACALCA